MTWQEKKTSSSPCSRVMDHGTGRDADVNEDDDIGGGSYCRRTCKSPSSPSRERKRGREEEIFQFPGLGRGSGRLFFTLVCACLSGPKDSVANWQPDGESGKFFPEEKKTCPTLFLSGTNYASKKQNIL